MKLNDKVIVITGGGGGIGRALALRFAVEKPKKIVVADRDLSAAQAVAREVDGVAIACDVGRESEIVSLIEKATAAAGPIDLFCANAGIAVGGGVDAPDSEWQRAWDVNFMSHVWAARVLVPDWIKRGGGYFLATASAAGLLTTIGAAPYSVTKHAVVSLAEWLSITHGDQGLRVSCLCPQYVNTAMLHSALQEIAGGTVHKSGPVLEPAAVAEAVVAGIEAERFLILPHPEVATYFQRKAGDYDRWLSAMRKLNAVK